MQINEANIDILRKDGKLVSAFVSMPIWDKLGMDDFISVNIPLFGIKTFAKDENDADKAIHEALTAFCINAEKFGKGLEEELKSIGWKIIPSKSNENFSSMVYSVSNTNSVLDQIMQTGEQVSQRLELAC